MKTVIRFAIAAAALAGGSASAQPGGAAEAVQAVSAAAERIEADYIDARGAPALARRLRSFAAGLRRNPREGEALAEELTRLLREADPHFRFGYSARPLPETAFAPPDPAAARVAAERLARVNNYGVLRAQRLAGNVGYIDLDQFTDPQLMRAPLAAAMELVRHCDALIIDLRFNGGGHARGAALAISYFLPESAARTLVRLQGRDPAQAVEIRTEGTLEAPRFLERPVLILTGPETFSAAEMFTSQLQHLRGATVVGTPTRGGSHPVTRVRLTAHYGLILPTSRSVTERDWENTGVTPDIPATAEQALDTARRRAVTGLLEARPDDLLADNWRRLLAPPTAPNPTPPASNPGVRQ